LSTTPQLVVENYFGVSGPAGLPKEVTDKLGAALAAIEADPVIVKRLEEPGITSAKMGSADFAAFVTKQVNDWQPAIKAADLKQSVRRSGGKMRAGARFSICRSRSKACTRFGPS
jgi:Tripartite tricarboxylate transporter family receptor